MNYKQIYTGVIISQSDYNNLPVLLRKNYIQCYEDVTHTYDDDIIVPLVIAGTELVIDAVCNMDNESVTVDTDSGSSDFSGFDGGDAGGAGAGGDW